MSIFDRLLKKKKEIFAKNEFCFVVEAMDEPTIKEDKKYASAGYFKRGATQFVDLLEDREYKCSYDQNGTLIINGKKMIILENTGEVFSEDYEQDRYYRPLVKSSAGEYSWVKSLRVASGVYSDDNLWLMFPNGDAFQDYFKFLLDDKAKLSINRIKMIVKSMNDSAEYLVDRENIRRMDNANTL